MVRSSTQPTASTGPAALDVAPGAGFRWALRGLIVVAMAAAGYLSFVSLSGGAEAMLGCAGLPHFDCEHVLTSRWSRWLDVPVSVPAVGVYAMMLAATGLLSPRLGPRVRRAAFGALVFGAVMAAGAAVWFIGLLVLVSEKLCSWCLVVHVCGLLAAGLILGRAWRGGARRHPLGGLAALGVAGSSGGSTPATSAELSRSAAVVMAGLGLLGLGLLVAGQALFPASRQQIVELPSDVAGENANATDGRPLAGALSIGAQTGGANPAVAGSSGGESEPEAPSQPIRRVERDIVVFGGTLKLSTTGFPIIGNPEARWILVSLSDYTCKHCRTLHGYLEQAQRRYGDQMAVMFLPVPMNTKCNRFVAEDHPDHKEACQYARLAAGVFLADPGKYAEFHHWLYAPEQLPSYVEAIDRAMQLVGRQPLEVALTDAGVDEFLNYTTTVYNAVGRGPIPILLVDKFLVRGEGNRAQDLFDFLEQRLDLKPIEPSGEPAEPGQPTPAAAAPADQPLQPTR